MKNEKSNPRASAASKLHRVGWTLPDGPGLAMDLTPEFLREYGVKLDG